MDPFLAEFYGTGASQEEMEKTAQLEMLEKIAEEEGVDLDDLSEEELEYILSEEGEEVEEDGEDMEKEAMEKFAEADFLGRVMAHANWDEFQKIAADEEKAPGRLRRAGQYMWRGKGKGHYGGARGAGRYAHGAVSALGAKLRTKKGIEKMRAAANEAAGSGSKGLKEFGKRMRRSSAIRGYGALGAGAAALGGGGYAAHRALKKKSADEIVEQRAAEFLMEAGIDPNEVFEKTAGYAQEDIDTAALQYLEDLGVPVTWYDQE